MTRASAPAAGADFSSRNLTDRVRPAIIPRRTVLSTAGAVLAGAIRPARASHDDEEREHHRKSKDRIAVLVDLTECVGCRLCEYACKKAHGFETGPLESYDDTSVFKLKRRPGPRSLTVINSWPTADVTKPVYAKVNCLHCNHPACVSACIVGALRKTDAGPVTYDAWKCIGCRYCMVACPFEIPKYEYDDALTPKVQKCDLCVDRINHGEQPACVTECPRNAMKFGRREDLLKAAHERIRAHPDRYIDHVYGESEAGGTSWLYLSPVPFEQAGFVKIGSTAPPALTERIQHGVFKYGLPPLALYGILGAAMFLTRPRDGARKEHRKVDQVVEPTAEQHAAARPVERRLLTPGVWALLTLAFVGLCFGLYRFIFGLSAATNLSQSHPWGLWIAVDVASGVALAAGGFTTAFLAHVLHRESYHAIVRPALLTAMLGYTFVVIGLMADLGRYYNVWHPMFMWQGNSVLFEVGMCVMCYLTVLYLEFAPIVCERLTGQRRFPRVARLAGRLNRAFGRIMFLLIIAGCVLSCLHQSSLGSLMVIAPTKTHELWWSPFSPLLFLLSAIAVGFPMVIFESLLASWSLRLKPELPLLARLARFIPFTLGIYLVAKVADMLWRGTWRVLGDGSIQSASWMIEMLGGVIIPMVILMSARRRSSRGWLAVAATLVVLGVVLNRVNAFLVGYQPPFADSAYFPSVGEFAVTIGLIATLMIVYRVCVTYLPVITHEPAEEKVPAGAQLCAV